MTQQPHPELGEEAAALRAQVAELTSAVSSLAQASAVSFRYAHHNRRIGVGLVLSLILDLGLTTGLVYTSHRQAAYVACQAAYNEINNRRTTILTDVSTRERTAERARNAALDATFLDPSLLKPVAARTPADAARVLALFVAYRNAAQKLRTEQAAADAARAANPIPPPPSQTCG